jgi:hypothetical protein
MYSPGDPYFAAPDETFTIAPPEPPCLIDIRFTASRAQTIAPTTLMANILSIREASIESSRI